MQIILNGQPFSVTDQPSQGESSHPSASSGPFSVAQLVAQRNLNPKQIAVEINQKLVLREDYEETLLADGDSVELVTLAGGG